MEPLENKVNEKIAPFQIPKVVRNCWMEPETVCPFSSEHTKILFLSGCNFSTDPSEYVSVTCNQCQKLVHANRVNVPVPVVLQPPCNRNRIRKQTKKY